MKRILIFCMTIVHKRHVKNKTLITNYVIKIDKTLSDLKFPPCYIEIKVRVQIPDVGRERGDSRDVLMPVIENTYDLYMLENKRGTFQENVLKLPVFCVSG